MTPVPSATSHRLPLAGALLWALLAAPCPAAAAGHPLDPLSADEITRTVEVIAASGRLTEPTRAAAVILQQPDKDAVLEGAHLTREAFAILRVGRETYEAIVDLDAGEIAGWTHVPGVQPPIQSAEWALAQEVVKADTGWKTAMRRRGYTAFDGIFCESLSAGYFAEPGEAGRRLLKMPCYDVAGARVNMYARPIEGLVATVDLDAGAVIELIDEGVVPVREAAHDFSAAVGAPPRPVRTVAPEGWNFTVRGRMVDWLGWSFHLGFDHRFGPVLSLVKRRDGDSARMILYQGHVSEIFVPYMHDTPSWGFRAYLDAGEFGLGALASPLLPGSDCPENAVFLDAALASSGGVAYERKRVLCVFERDRGAPLWRHYEALTGESESRPATELVVRAIPSIAHYDYVFDWVFTQSGAIRVEIGATGIDSVQGLDDHHAPRTASRGAVVAPGLLAVNHDHYFGLRLDLDIDGRLNRFVRERLELAGPPSGVGRTLWRTVAETVRREAGFSAGGMPELWRVENPEVIAPPGQHPGYRIEGCGPTSLLLARDWPQRRAAFSGSEIWVTRYRPGELFASGAYPNQSPGGEGLAAYADGEPIEAADLVTWCTIGIRHVTRPEDWPVLTTMWREIALRPYGFFSRNPAVGAD